MTLIEDERECARLRLAVCVLLIVVVRVCVCQCACVLLIKKIRPGGILKSLQWLHLKRSARMLHTNTYIYNLLSMLLRWDEGKNDEQCAGEKGQRSDREWERSYHLLWFWAVWGCLGGRHPSVCTPAPAARTSCLFGEPQGALTHFPLHLPPEHWGDLLSPSHRTTPIRRHTETGRQVTYLSTIRSMDKKWRNM